MNGRELWKCWALGLLLTMAGIPVRAKVAPKSPVVVTISMHNDAAVPWETIRAAEREASHVFSEAGIAVEWVNCQAGSEEAIVRQGSDCGEAIFPEHLHLRIAKRSFGLSPTVMGISFLSEDGRGIQADLFYEEIKELWRKSDANMASISSILGYVASHEIGHLLLGTNSHAPYGIMRAVWGRDELIRVGVRALFFSDQQSAKMRAKLGSVEAHRNHARLASDAYSN